MYWARVTQLSKQLGCKWQGIAAFCFSLPPPQLHVAIRAGVDAYRQEQLEFASRDAARASWICPVWEPGDRTSCCLLLHGTIECKMPALDVIDEGA
ncbi:hypothetical protein GOP47_0014328 [Adiantum capillus-veneris]|uniref:Uncharacterized protein n=1 Tax=Adiantum capillus-veneris TaxID=13818 RepID=A0A9D4ZE21_ADICA|nr:hypothetical protein GOP47_0014328 [Adiantum capillus-veneris]